MKNRVTLSIFVWFGVWALIFSSCSSTADPEENDSTETTLTDILQDSPDTEGDIETETKTGGATAECGENLPNCSSGLLCVKGVCLVEPMEDATIAHEYDDGAMELDEPPNISCWESPLTAPEGEHTTVRVTGDVDRFGPGSKTKNVCITFYNYHLFLDFFAASDCDSLVNDEDIIACYGKDPCRCDDLGGESEIQSCYMEIGYCKGIIDSGTAEECRTTYGGSVVVGYGLSVDSGSSRGIFSVDDIPTNKKLAVKASGSTMKWIDSYEYGAYMRRDKVGIVDEIPTINWDANIISTAAWNTIPSTAGLPAGMQNMNGAIAGQARDCGLQNHPEYEDRGPEALVHATVGLVQDATLTAYFNGNPDDTLPQPGRIDTNLLGTYAALDMESGLNRVSVAVSIDGQIINAGFRDVFMPPHSVAICTFEGNWEESE